MPYETPFPAQGTNPWYLPLKGWADGLVQYVNGLATGGGGSSYPVQRITATGNITISSTGWPTDQVVALVVTQDATGGRTVTLGSGIALATGATYNPGTAGNSETDFVFRYSPVAGWLCLGARISYAGSTPPVNTPPTQPGVVTTVTDTTSVTMSFATSTDADGDPITYALSRDNGLSWAALTTVGTTTRTATVSGLSPNTTYSTWRIKATAAGADSTARIISNFTTQTVVVETWTNAITADAPVHWWPMNEPSGSSTFVHQGSGADGTKTLTGTPGFGAATLGGTGTSVAFDNSQKLNTGVNNLFSWTAGTFECLVGLASGNTGGVMFSIGGFIKFSMNANSFSLTVNGGSATKGSLALGTTKHHMAVTISGTVIRLFLDGTLAATGSRSADTAFATAGEQLIIAGRDTPGFVGKLSDVVLYTTIVSDSRIYAHAVAAGVASP